MRSNAVLARRRLALSLRRHREGTGLTAQELARGMECSAAKISRMEAGVVGVRKEDVEAFAAVVDLSSTERDAMVELVREARRKGWWQEFVDTVPPGSSTFFGLEDGATSISQRSTSLVPGLLQTPEYAMALTRSVDGVTPDLAERRLALRMRRQQVLDLAEPPQLTVLLDEAVLYRDIGNQNLMVGQWKHLLRRAAADHVVVRILPFQTAFHPADGVGFTVFGFGEGLPPVAYAELLSRNTFIDEPAEVEVYKSALEAAERVAASPERSRELIAARVRAVA